MGIGRAQWVELDGYQAVRGKDCMIYLERRGFTCDRGRFFARLVPDAGSELARSLGEEDCWPRYYFDEGRAKLEVEAWLDRQGQLVEESPKQPKTRPMKFFPPSLHADPDDPKTCGHAALTLGVVWPALPGWRCPGCWLVYDEHACTVATLPAERRDHPDEATFRCFVCELLDFTGGNLTHANASAIIEQWGEAHRVQALEG